jgi:hypothetical protein
MKAKLTYIIFFKEDEEFHKLYFAKLENKIFKGFYDKFLYLYIFQNLISFFSYFKGILFTKNVKSSLFLLLT